MDTVDSITEDELVAALFSAQEAATGKAANGALTTRALTKLVGRNREWVRERLRVLKDAGLVEPVRVQVVDIAGRETTAPAYRLIVKGQHHDDSSQTEI